MAPRGRSNTDGDLMGGMEDSSNGSPSSIYNGKTKSIKSSASSIRSLRKRHSFFSRSSSDAGRGRKLNPIHTSTSSEDSTQEQSEQTTARPRTALSTDQSSIRSRSQPFESLRASLFSSRRNGPTVPTRERADSSTLPAAMASAVPAWSREHFSNKDDYDRHLTKQTISPPFNFMHVTHTAAQQLPALDTVEEKDLPGEFWSVSAYQRPRRHLHGIKADNLPKKRQPSESSPISPISPSSRPISPIAESELDSQPIGRARIGSIENISPIDETMFDEISQTRFDPDAGALSLQPAKQVLKYPKRYSSLTALNQRSQADSRGVAQGDAQAANMNTFYESNSSVASGDAGSRTVSPNIQRDPPDPNTDIQKSAEMQRDFEPKQALPALPDKKPSSNQFKDVKKSTSTSNMSLIMPQPTSPRSKRSSRSLRSTMKSPTFSSHSDFRNSMTFSDYASWEDDVDFSYEQAAESTCDFNWDIISRPREDSTQTLDTGLSVSSYHAYSPAVSNDSSSSLRFNGMNASSETIAERRRSRVAASPGHHKRGSSVASVGHRGFLAARKSSTDLTAMAQQPNPTPLQISPNLDNSAQVNVLSPVFSVTGADDEQEKSPFTPDAIHYPRFDSVITENLSDPESCRNSGSSKHRKSSSYGSHESTARPQPNPAKESNRWSVASVSSLPDLLHPRTKKTHLSKTIISSPLEALPQSPPSETDTVAKRESRIIPAEFQNQTNRNSFVMRRPQTSGDRAAMQAAGRMVQRRGARPATPQRMSRIIQTPDGMAVPEAEKTGPKWI